jgi:Domain of unknown function (DUF4124)
MRKFVWIVAPFFLVATPAAAEIFKCVGKGVVVYQNFRCEIDSLGSLPSGPTVARPSDSNQARPTTVAAGSGTTPATEPRVGMSTEEVRAVWGEPTDTYNEEPGGGGRSEVWVYGNDRSVRFDHRSRVTAVLKQPRG